MDEQKIRMRQEMIKQARQGRAINRKKSPPTPGKQFFLFRIYVRSEEHTSELQSQ